MEYRITPEMEQRLTAMSYEDRQIFWNTEYPEYMKAMPIADLLFLAQSTLPIRIEARVLLETRIEDAGLKGGVAPCCGYKFDWRSTAQALAHIKTSPCPMGFQIIDGKCICDCTRVCGTPEDALAHQHKIGNCLHDRRRRQALFCVVCEHQSETKKQHEEHLASTTHYKTANPVKLTCDCCEVVCRTKKEFDRHCAGKQHKYKADPSNRPTYSCSCCTITCSTQKQFEAHQQTNKHKKNMETKTNGD
jgi:hypothetical protein